MHVLALRRVRPARFSLLFKSCSRLSSEDVTTQSSTSSTRNYRIYTKTGDKGTSSLYNGQRRSKGDLFFEALGDVDELKGFLGLCREYLKTSLHGTPEKNTLEAQLEEIQSRLLDVGSAIATPKSSSSPDLSWKDGSTNSTLLCRLCAILFFHLVVSLLLNFT